MVQVTQPKNDRDVWQKKPIEEVVNLPGPWYSIKMVDDTWLKWKSKTGQRVKMHVSIECSWNR